jgi:hypothetical protein
MICRLKKSRLKIDSGYFLNEELALCTIIEHHFN